MRFLWFCWALGFLAAPGLLRAQSADDRYVRVYSLLEDADKLNGAGQTREAVTKFLEAQVAVKDLQRAHPEWNTSLVAFRLNYISSQLESLTRKAATSTSASSSNAPAESVSPTQALTSQLKTLQEEIGRLAAQNALLEAKLREALSVQPASSDPRELTKAEDKIKALQKERDLLVASLEQSGGKSAAAATAAASTDSKQQLVTQGAVVSVLQKQNEELLKQISTLSSKGKGPKAAELRENLSLRETIAELEARNKFMREEQTAMENRLLDFVRRHGAGAAKEQELQGQLAAARAAAATAERERDELLQKLTGVTRELNQRDDKATTARTRELEQELESIRAKLHIFEAKAVPYSAEELALFKQAPIKVAAAVQTNAPAATTKPATTPAGTGPLLADAQRAVDAGRLAEAETKYREVLRQDENNVHVLANLAAVQLDQAKTAEAEATLTKSLAIDQNDALSLYLLGGLKLEQEKYDEALEMLSRSAKLAPEMAQAQYYLGKALIHQGDRGPAEAALRKAVQLKPGWGDAHYLLAVLYATQQPNYRELAQYHYRKAIAGGAGRNLELERRMEKAATASPPPQP